MNVIRERGDQKPWLVLDGDDLNIVKANREGLMALRDSVDIALKFSDDERPIEFNGVAVDEIEISKIIVIEKEEHYGDNNDDDGEGVKKTSIFLFIMWCFVLPFVAIGFMIKLIIDILS